MKHTENYRVAIHDTDVNNIVSASAVLRYMQEAGNLQCEGTNADTKKLRAEGKAFILSKLSMNIYKPLYAYDQIIAQSWPCDSKGMSFNRCARILRDGNIIAELATVWAFVNLNDRKLIRVTDFDVDMSLDEPLELDMPARVRIPRNAELSLVGERTAMYSDIDINNHVNNTNYIDMLCDFIPNMKGLRVISVIINYINEMPLGETVKVYSLENDGTYYFRTIRENGSTGVEAEIVIDEL